MEKFSEKNSLRKKKFLLAWKEALSLRTTALMCGITAYIGYRPALPLLLACVRSRDLPLAAAARRRAPRRVLRRTCDDSSPLAPPCPPSCSGLKRLEYRGYDSAGVGLHTGSALVVVKRAGKVGNCEAACASLLPPASPAQPRPRTATAAAEPAPPPFPHFFESESVLPRLQKRRLSA